MEVIVLDGEEVTEPNKSDYCLGEQHHQRLYDENDGHSIFGIHWRSRIAFDEISLLKGAFSKRFIAD